MLSTENEMQIGNSIVFTGAFWLFALVLVGCGESSNPEASELKQAGGPKIHVDKTIDLRDVPVTDYSFNVEESSWPVDRTGYKNLHTPEDKNCFVMAKGNPGRYSGSTDTLNSLVPGSFNYDLMVEESYTLTAENTLSFIPENALGFDLVAGVLYQTKMENPDKPNNSYLDIYNDKAVQFAVITWLYESDQIENRKENLWKECLNKNSDISIRTTDF